jgi:hypothetical protein
MDMWIASASNLSSGVCRCNDLRSGSIVHCPVWTVRPKRQDQKRLIYTHLSQAAEARDLGPTSSGSGSPDEILAAGLEPARGRKSESRG